MMKVSNAYFKHPITGETIKPGEMYQDFDKGAVVMHRANITAEDKSDTEQDEKTEKELNKNFEKELNTDSKPLSERGITELKRLAKEAKIAGYSGMEKDELVAALLALEGKMVISTENDGINTGGSDSDVKNNDNNENS